MLDNGASGFSTYRVSWTLPLAYTLVQLIRVGLTLLNLRYVRVHGAEAPGVLVGELDEATLRKSQRYSVDRLQFGVVRAGLTAVILGGLLFGGGLQLYDEAITQLRLDFVAEGVVFFVILVVLGTVLDLPFAFYATFRLEERHGFNRMSVGLFLADVCKGLLLGGVLTALLAGGAFWLVRVAPETWWLWAFLGYAGFSAVLVLVAPYVIEPLFFKTKPLDIEDLREDMRAMSQRAGVSVNQVLEVDASRRSAHSNAYFTGIGRVKRIVLFDTLKQQLNHQEILAIVAHELGHWKLRHISQRFLVSLGMALAGIYLAFRIVSGGQPWHWGWLDDPSFAARAVVAGLILSLFAFPFAPLFSRWSRAHEWQADTFAVGLTGRPGALASALLKLARGNLSGLRAHPFYESFFYSHPPLTQRIARWRAAEESAQGTRGA